MERYYGSYRLDIADSLIQVDNIIDKTKHEIKELEERRNAKLDDSEIIKGINDF